MHRIIRIISERSPVFFCSNVTFKHPCPAFQESFSGITESGTPVTHFYQTGDASNSAAGETAKTIRTCVWCCAGSDQAGTAAGDRVIE